MSEWINEKLKVYMCMFSISLLAWEDLLKFETAAWNSYHWSIYCASAKVKSCFTAIAWSKTFAINEFGPMVTKDFKVAGQITCSNMH